MPSPVQPAAPPASRLHPWVAPFAVFLAFLALTAALAPWWPDSIFLIYPIQTVVCAGILWFYRRAYVPVTNGRGFPYAAFVGLVVLALWVAPVALRLAPARLDGFNPDRLAASPVLQSLTVAARFIRLAIVVPVLEEVFWRGYLLRRWVSPDWSSVPFGTFSWRSCLGVAALFAAEHQTSDWPAGFAAGLLYNAVAYRTRNLAACILSHALTNLGLGLYVCATRQWGFW